MQAPLQQGDEQDRRRQTPCQTGHALPLQQTGPRLEPRMAAQGGHMGWCEMSDDERGDNGDQCREEHGAIPSPVPDQARQGRTLRKPREMAG